MIWMTHMSSMEASSCWFLYDRRSGHHYFWIGLDWLQRCLPLRLQKCEFSFLGELSLWAVVVRGEAVVVWCSCWSTSSTEHLHSGATRCHSEKVEHCPTWRQRELTRTTVSLQIGSKWGKSIAHQAGTVGYRTTHQPLRWSLCAHGELRCSSHYLFVFFQMASYGFGVTDIYNSSLSLQLPSFICLGLLCVMQDPTEDSICPPPPTSSSLPSAHVRLRWTKNKCGDRARVWRVFLSCHSVQCCTQTLHVFALMKHTNPHTHLCHPWKVCVCVCLLWSHWGNHTGAAVCVLVYHVWFSSSVYLSQAPLFQENRRKWVSHFTNTCVTQTHKGEHTQEV